MKLWNLIGLASTGLRQAILFGTVGAIVTSVVVVNTLTATDIGHDGPGDQKIGLAFNTFIADPDTTVATSTATGIEIISSDTVAAGTSAPGVEPASGTYPAVNNTLNADNYAYKFDVIEASDGAWGVGENLRIEVYGYLTGTDTSAKLTTLYTDQASAEAGAIEGVTVTVDLGSTTQIYDNIDIVVTRQ